MLVYSLPHGANTLPPTLPRAKRDSINPCPSLKTQKRAGTSCPETMLGGFKPDAEAGDDREVEASPDRDACHNHMCRCGAGIRHATTSSATHEPNIVFGS